MEMTVRDVAQMMAVPERTVRRWVSDGEIPTRSVAGQHRFNRHELFEWAITRKMELYAEFHRNRRHDSPPAEILAAALESGDVLFDIPGRDKASALRAMVERMSLPPGFDDQVLLNLFQTRESLGMTGVGDGIAIPHARYPVVLSAPAPLLHLCFLSRPIQLGNPNDKPVDTLFLLVSPTVRHHLALLAQLAYALGDRPFRGLIRRKAPRDEILRGSRRVFGR